ncbi:MAG: hypothetical protein HYT43_02685 [Candidatus Taylorbacteria bacterium]|nr:hypothetical protein [Candidatus Taylorbacteria bacterium]
MDKPRITAKDFFLWAGAMVTFYWSVIAYILLTFDYINYAFPNPLAFYPSDPYQSGISYEMASIIVLLPLYLVLMRFIRRDIARDPSRMDIWVRRWALILTLFVAGVAVTVDFIVLLTTFLNGEALTTAFLLKVLVIFLVAGAVFLHFIADMRGYWTAFPDRKRLVVIGVSVLAVATIVSGFFIVGTPGQARLARFDAQKVSDLQNIQSQVVYYWQAKQKLPGMITDLNNSLNYGPVPADPQSGEPYVYQPGEGLSFKLCAMFNAESRGSQNVYYEPRAMMPVPAGGKGMMQDNWQHGMGQVCFERIIDPAFYPPLNKDVIRP